MERFALILRTNAARVLPLLVAAALGIPSAAHGAATTIRESAFGLPHIFADTDLELARENGREIAKDRLGQMILLARVGRGTLYQAFGALDATTLNGDIETRRTGYTSSELNNMWAKLPQRERDMVMEYCKGVNDTIDAVYAGTSPEPIEVNLLRNFLGLADDLFGNKNNVSDGVDPNYAPAGGAWPNGGFQFTPEMAMSIAVLEVRNFGFESLEEDARFAELQSLIAARGAGPGTEIWDDLNFLNDPLAPVSVPDPNTPGFGGPLAAVAPQLLVAAARFPHYDYRTHAEQRRAAAEARKETAMRWGAWPALGSYAWVIGGNKTTTGYPWLGGFPQTGIQTPSIMHFAENRSAEGTSNRINGIGMEFAGAPLVLIGQTDSVAYTTTTALLRLVDTFFEQIVGEDSDGLHYSDEGSPALLKQRTETILGGLAPSVSRVFYRTHERNGNGGSRPVTDFTGDHEGTVDSAGANTLLDSGAFDASYTGGHVAIVDGPGAGQIRAITGVPDASTLHVAAWTTVPTTASTYVAVKAGHNIIAVAIDSTL
jgi:penicillin amidase